MIIEDIGLAKKITVIKLLLHTSNKYAKLVEGYVSIIKDLNERDHYIQDINRRKERYQLILEAGGTEIIYDQNIETVNQLVENSKKDTKIFREKAILESLSSKKYAINHLKQAFKQIDDIRIDYQKMLPKGTGDLLSDCEDQLRETYFKLKEHENELPIQ